MIGDTVKTRQDLIDELKQQISKAEVVNEIAIPGIVIPCVNAEKSPNDK